MDTSVKLSYARTQHTLALEIQDALEQAYAASIAYLGSVLAYEQVHIPDLVGALHGRLLDLRTHTEGLKQKVKNLEKAFEKECLALEGTDKHGTMLPPAPAQDVFVEPPK